MTSWANEWVVTANDVTKELHRATPDQVVAHSGAVVLPFSPYSDNDATNVQSAIEQTLDERVPRSLSGVEKIRVGATGIALGSGYDATQALHLRNTGGACSVLIEADGSADLILNRYSADAGPASLDIRKGRGTRASPGQVLAGDDVFELVGRGYDNSGTPTVRRVGSINLGAVGNITSTNAEGRWKVNACPNGSTSSSELLRADHATGFSMYGANVVIDSNRLVRTRVYTVATLPTVGTKGRKAFVSDATAPTYLGTLTGGGAVNCPVVDNGTAWVSC